MLLLAAAAVFLPISNAVKCAKYLNRQNLGECDGRFCYMYGRNQDNLNQGCSDDRNNFTMQCIDYIDSSLCLCDTDRCNSLEGMKNLPHVKPEHVACHSDTVYASNECSGLACFRTQTESFSTFGCITNLGNAYFPIPEYSSSQIFAYPDACYKFTLEGTERIYCRCSTDFCNTEDLIVNTANKKGDTECYLDTNSEENIFGKCNGDFCATFGNDIAVNQTDRSCINVLNLGTYNLYVGKFHQYMFQMNVCKANGCNYNDSTAIANQPTNMTGVKEVESMTFTTGAAVQNQEIFMAIIFMCLVRLFS